MIKVTIASTQVREQSGTSKTTGKPYNMAFQDAWFHTIGRDGKPAPFPQKVELILPRNEQGAALYFAPGEYQLAPSSVYVDRGGKLAIDGSQLVALKQPAATARPTA